MTNKDSIQQVLAEADALWGHMFTPTARTGAISQNVMSPAIAIHCLPGRPPFMAQSDVAKIYGVKTEKLNQARKRNPAKFQEGVDFFPLEKGEVAKCDLAYNGGHLPYAYTRRGAYMFATILQTPEATEQAIRIVEGFMTFEHALAQKAAQAPAPQLPPPAPRTIEVVPTVTVNALELAQRDAEFWKLKFQLEQKTQECAQLKLQQQRKGKAKGGNSYTKFDEEAIMVCLKAGLSYAKIGKKMTPARSGDAIRRKTYRLKAQGNL